MVCGRTATTVITNATISMTLSWRQEILSTLSSQNTWIDAALPIVSMCFVLLAALGVANGSVSWEESLPAYWKRSKTGAPGLEGH